MNRGWTVPGAVCRRGWLDIVEGFIGRLEIVDGGVRGAELGSSQNAVFAFFCYFNGRKFFVAVKVGVDVTKKTELIMTSAH